MDASFRTSYLRNLTVFTNYRDRASYKTNSVPDNEILNERIVGKVESATVCPCTTNDIAPPCIFSIQSIVLEALETLFIYSANANLGPTRSSRLHYLFFATIASGYNWVMPSGPISGTKDNWNWNTRYPLSNAMERYTWMVHLLATTMPLLLPTITSPPTVPPTYDSTVLTSSLVNALIEGERTTFMWDIPTQNNNVHTVQSKAAWSVWLNSWTNWFNQRNADGSVPAEAIAGFPTNAQLPNHGTVLDVLTTQDFTDSVAYPNPTEWTQLKVNGATKKWYTYNWETVQSTCLSSGDETNIKGVATPLFPTTVQRTNEIAALVGITDGNNLTENQKVQAEFWANGVNTISPPGTFIWFWKTLFLSKTISEDVLFYSGLDLSIHLFEAGRIVWGIKQTYAEARPIQEIRRLYKGQTLTKYDGTSIAGELWVPYQTANFVTPPFPDFCSGHSAFGKCFADVMTDWFGAAIPKTKAIRQTDLYLLSKVFNGITETNPFGTWVFKASTSEIQGTIPAVDTTLSWSTWNNMATSCGLSRQYGGIHAMSAHTASQAVANSLHSYIRANWGLTPF